MSSATFANLANLSTLANNRRIVWIRSNTACIPAKVTKSVFADNPVFERYEQRLKNPKPQLVWIPKDANKKTVAIPTICSGCDRCTDGVWGASIILIQHERLIIAKQVKNKYYAEFGGCYDSNFDSHPTETAVREYYEETIKTGEIPLKVVQRAPQAEYHVTCRKGPHKYVGYIVHDPHYQYFNPGKYTAALYNPEHQSLPMEQQETMGYQSLSISYLQRMYSRLGHIPCHLKTYEGQYIQLSYRTRLLLADSFDKKLL